jgi:hypothetical protein
MAREPHYPKDATVGSGKRESESEGTGEAIAAASAAREASGGGRSAEGKRGKHLAAGAAIGIGSAAIVAALLYARRGKGDRGGNG